MMQHEETSLLACQKKKTCFKWMKSYHCENELCLCLLDQHTDKQPHKTKQPLCQLSVSEPLCSSSQISWIKPQWVTVRERWRVEILKNALIVVRALRAVKTHSATRQQGSHTPPLAHHHNYAHMGEKERQNKIKKKKNHTSTLMVAIDLAMSDNSHHMDTFEVICFEGLVASSLIPSILTTVVQSHTSLNHYEQWSFVTKPAFKTSSASVSANCKI